MTTRSEREKAQRQNEEHQTILADLLRQEANKYCADCEAKGPRWASWNLGVFLCIRCAGIHRNLGVHISRVKSVNLDQWTQQQIQNMQELGNARAPQIYEGRLPPDFKRPQSDHAVEMFVRDKYEKKKYMDKNVDLNVLKQREKLKEKKNEVKPAVVEKARVEKSPEQQGMHKAVRAKTPGLDMDLLGLDAQGWNESPKSTPTGASGDLDIFGPMVSNPLPASTPTSQATVTTAAKPVNQGQSSANDLNLFLDASTQSEDNSKKTMSKDSILSLYGNQHGHCVPQGPVYLPPGASIAYMPSTAAPMTYPSVPVNAPQNAMIGVAPVGVPGATVRVPVGGSMSNGLMGNQLGLGTSAFAAGTATGTLGQSGLLGYTSISNVPTWNMTQVSQQMTGLSVGMPGGMGAYSAPQNMSSWATSPQTNQALSTHVWK